MNSFSDRVCNLVSGLPFGKVVTYGELAIKAGSPRSARQVGRILHSQSEKRNLPWHRVVASGGRIVLSDPRMAALQRALLIAEGVSFAPDGTIIEGAVEE